MLFWEDSRETENDKKARGESIGIPFCGVFHTDFVVRETCAQHTRVWWAGPWHLYFGINPSGTKSGIPDGIQNWRRKKLGGESPVVIRKEWLWLQNNWISLSLPLSPHSRSLSPPPIILFLVTYVQYIKRYFIFVLILPLPHSLSTLGTSSLSSFFPCVFSMFFSFLLTGPFSVGIVVLGYWRRNNDVTKSWQVSYRHVLEHAH